MELTPVAKKSQSADERDPTWSRAPPSLKEPLRRCYRLAGRHGSSIRFHAQSHRHRRLVSVGLSIRRKWLEPGRRIHDSTNLINVHQPALTGNLEDIQNKTWAPERNDGEMIDDTRTHDLLESCVTQANVDLAGRQGKNLAEGDTIGNPTPNSRGIGSGDNSVHAGDRIAQGIDHAELQITRHDLCVNAHMRGGE